MLPLHLCACDKTGALHHLPAAFVYSLIAIVVSRVNMEFESHGLFFEVRGWRVDPMADI